jgi:hypothetical protein
VVVEETRTVPSTGDDQHDWRYRRYSPAATVFVLLLWQAAALGTQVLAVYLARHNLNALAQVVTALGVGLAFASALWVLTRPGLTRSVRNAAVLCLGIIPALQWHLRDPLLPTEFDEQLHLRTLRDIVSSHRLFEPNPLIRVSPHYPGLEAVTALLHQLGLPLIVAATVLVLAARAVLVLVLSDAVEHVTGSCRAGGLAVAAYACANDFVSWDSQFAYETLALPLALAAVSFIARARQADHPGLLLTGASVCLLAAAITHHVTSVVTAAFLAIWALVQRGPSRRYVFYGATIAVGVATAWSMINWSLLSNYFGWFVVQSFAELFGGSRRVPFSTSAIVPVPLWEIVLICFYAVAVGLIVSTLALVCARSVLRRLRPGAPRNIEEWQPRIFLVLIVLPIPVLFLARTVSVGFIQISDRSNTFLFLPLSLLVADGVVRWSRSRPLRQLMRVRPVAMVLATGVFIGGYLLSSGPDWARLPGPYLPGAEGRSIDAETLAAVHWAHDGLPGGSRIAADRTSGTLLSSQAGLWPVKEDDEYQTPPLYFADDWGPDRDDAVREMRLRYLYVDRRLADGLPLVGEYFTEGETEQPQKLTLDELTKFDDVPGIQVRYRHGPITIYDLSGLGEAQTRSGWIGSSPPPSIPLQVASGLVVGLLLASAVRFGAGAFVVEKAKVFRNAAGTALTMATGLSAACAVSVAMLSVHIWLGPFFYLSAALAVLLANPHWWKRFEVGLRRVRLGWIAATSVVVLLVAGAIALAAQSASVADITTVQEILHDPSATHLPER